ncbi:FAD-dependent oxidoreductase [Halonatronum saccharophilum]|uniref:FAD-dependent oxidoreductase n=1 Tax=Halonatronum saccharophilum TaxID=150060 RepID=UPI000487A0B8|nr:FAD-dependent oxidoreductase [Halonatronum saccharophilum]
MLPERLPEDLVTKMNEIVEDCMGDAPPYCEATCPLHIDVQGYVKLIGEGEYKKALDLIRETTPFPGILGRVCAHPCEEKCKREEIDNALSVKNLKRFVADKCDDPKDWDLNVKEESEKKVAIIGSGPAGALAAYDLRKMGHQVTIFEALPVVGGMLRVGIPEYRLPHNVIDKEYSILEKLGVDIKLNTKVGEDISFKKLEEDYDAIFIGVGAHKSFILPIEGSDLAGVQPGVDILRKAGLEKHDKVEIGERVLVIGGGNVAMDVARTAWREGAKEVHIACVESRDQMPAHSWEIDDALEEEITLHDGWGPMKINGEDKVESITLKKCTQVFDQDGSFNPAYDVCNLKDIEVDNVIFAIGQSSEADFLAGDDSIELMRGNKIKVDPVTLQTTKEKVFAGGDGAGRPLLAIEAMAHGRKVATSIDRYLKGENLYENRDYEGTYQSWLKKELAEDEPRRERISIKMLPVDERRGNFKEVEFAYTPSEARGEALRCLECQCKLCMQECEMLNDFCISPKDLFKDIIKGEVAPLIHYSCNMCSQCTIVCPHEFELKNHFMEMRKLLVKNNDGKSPMKGHNAIEWHQKLGFSGIFTTTVGASKDKEGA